MACCCVHMHALFAHCFQRCLSCVCVCVYGAGKNKNITTLKKTEVDWGRFKEKEGIEDELATYRKDGYVEKMGFLQRSDARLDEILRKERQAERETRKPVSGPGAD